MQLVAAPIGSGEVHATSLVCSHVSHVVMSLTAFKGNSLVLRQAKLSGFEDRSSRG